MEIKLNGKRINTDCKTVFKLKKNKSDTAILDGYQISEDAELKEGANVCIFDKSEIPRESELEAMMCARHTPDIHEKLKKASVAIAGLGGLGSNVAAAMARIGVGKLLLVDFDTVDATNLNRQHYSLSHLGLYKTEALKSQLSDINPYIKIEAVTARVTEENAAEIFSGYDIICEAFDNPECKAMLVSAICGKKIVAGSGMAGYGSSNDIKTQRLMKNLYVCGDMVSEARIGVGLMAPRVLLCAAHQANMILRLILNIDEE